MSQKYTAWKKTGESTIKFMEFPKKTGNGIWPPERSCSVRPCRNYKNKQIKIREVKL